MNPQKVIGFLDVTGDWDPTLMFVISGAWLVTVSAFRLILKRPRPVLAEGFALLTKNAPYARLIGGRRCSALAGALGVLFRPGGGGVLTSPTGSQSFTSSENPS